MENNATLVAAVKAVPGVCDFYDGIELGYALGWGVLEPPYGRSIFKVGHDDGWERHLVCFPDKQSCLVLMTNSSNGDEVFMDLRRL